MEPRSVFAELISKTTGETLVRSDAVVALQDAVSIMIQRCLTESCMLARTSAPASGRIAVAGVHASAAVQAVCPAVFPEAQDRLSMLQDFARYTLQPWPGGSVFATTAASDWCRTDLYPRVHVADADIAAPTSPVENDAMDTT